MTGGLSEMPPEIGAIIKTGDAIPEFDEYISRKAAPLLVVLTGPSGVGKDVTLSRLAQTNFPFHYVVTVTTRGIRPNEINGKHYFFVSRSEYADMLAAGEFLENAEVYGNFYGVPKSQVTEALRRGVDVIMKPDVQGAASIKRLEPDAVYIFLAPPSMEELAERLYQRKTEDPAEFARRLDVARQEMHAVGNFDYVVVNRKDKLDETVSEIMAIIRAEKSRVHSRTLRLLGSDDSAPSQNTSFQR